MNIRYPAIIKAQKPNGYFVRFPDIEEDEPPLYLLSCDYEQFLGKR